MPEQNIEPAPVSTTARTSGSVSARSSASASCVSMGPVMPLRCSGRLIVMQAVRPLFSYRMSDMLQPPA
jgi:lipase chaperone LimK